MNGIQDVGTIKWNSRTMELRGSYWWAGKEPVVSIVAYAHVAATQLVRDDAGKMVLCIIAQGVTFSLRFECESNARDAAAELHNRMEAVGR